RKHFWPAKNAPGAMAVYNASHLFGKAMEWVNPGRGGQIYIVTVNFKFSPDGSQSIFTTNNVPISNGGAFDTAGNLYFSVSTSGEIAKFAPDGTHNSTFASGLNHPAGLAFDSAGNLYVADQGSGNIYKFAPDGTQSTVATG